MKILPPLPTLLPYSRPLPFDIKDLERLSELQSNLNQDFVDRYFPYFEWFTEVLPHVESTLNLGCSYGKETFSLAWELEARTVGIDKNHDKIDCAKRWVEFISDFRIRFPEQILPLISNPDRVKQLQTWWYKEMPNEIRQGVLPEFLEQDFSLSIPDNHFDLVYCRYFLWGIAEKDQNSLHSVCQNIKNAVRPETGRVVIVEPTKKGDVTYDFIGCLQDVGLTLLNEVERKQSRLGRMELDDPENLKTGLANPEGYILKRGKVS
ncbi:class I SAM-dependent methyltransferase [Chloroflexota bacterium]